MFIVLINFWKELQKWTGYHTKKHSKDIGGVKKYETIRAPFMVKKKNSRPMDYHFYYVLHNVNQSRAKRLFNIQLTVCFILRKLI